MALWLRYFVGYSFGISRRKASIACVTWPFQKTSISERNRQRIAQIYVNVSRPRKSYFDHQQKKNALIHISKEVPVFSKIITALLGVCCTVTMGLPAMAHAESAHVPPIGIERQTTKHHPYSGFYRKRRYGKIEGRVLWKACKMA